MRSLLTAGVALACEDSGSASFTAAWFVNVVVTTMKMSTTISTSISATMMTMGGFRFLRGRNRMGGKGVYFPGLTGYCRRRNLSSSVSISMANVSIRLL